MPTAKSTHVYVPKLFSRPGTRGVVVKRAKRDGDRVESEDVLFEIRSDDVDGKVLAPFAGTFVRTYAEEGDLVSVGSLLAELRVARPRPAPRVVDGPEPLLVRRAAVAVAVAIAAPALLVPTLALLVAALTALAVAGADHGRERDRDLALPIGVVWVAVGAVLWLLRMIVGVIPLAFALLRIAWWLVLAAGTTWVVGVGWWLVHEGSVGELSAGRLAVYEHGYGVFAFLAVRWLTVRGLRRLDAGQRIEAYVADRRPVVRALLATALAAALALCVAAPAGVWFPARDYAAVADLLPVGAGEWLDAQRAALAETEVDGVLACLADHRRGAWAAPIVYADAYHDLGAVVRPHRGYRPGARAVGTLLLALQSQLAPQRSQVTVRLRGGRGLQLATVPAAAPVQEVGRLDVEATPRAAALLAEAGTLKRADVEVALRCSAVAV